jgi:hypothetical protein
LKVIILSAVAALVLGYLASFVLNQGQELAHSAFRGAGAEVRDPGHNLVGPNWNGLNEPERPRS